MPIVFVLLFLAVFIGLAVASSRKLNQKRSEVQARIESQRSQMAAFAEQSRGLDEKTQERIRLAQESVEGKLQQATVLLKAAAKDRHFDRIGRILALVHTKLSNVETSMERARARVDERLHRQAESAQRREAERAQRQTEAAARRAGSFGRTSCNGSSRTGSFAPPAQVTDANTAWQSIPLNERGACFFCSRPCMMRELTPVVVPIGGADRRVLACPSDFTSVRSGVIPRIRAFAYNGRPIPWYACHNYNPYDDYYGDGVTIFNTYSYDDFDPGFWNFNGGFGNDEPSYNFSPDTPAYQDYSSGLAASAIFAGESDNIGSGDAGGLTSADDFGEVSQTGDFTGADQS